MLQLSRPLITAWKSIYYMLDVISLSHDKDLMSSIISQAVNNLSSIFSLFCLYQGTFTEQDETILWLWQAMREVDSISYFLS